MRKNFLIGIVAAAAMVGCIKRTEVTPGTGGALGMATIQGNVYITTDFRNDTNNQNGTTPANSIYTWELADAQGIQVSAEYDADELDPNYTGSNNKVTVFTTVDANGFFTLDVETPAGGQISVDMEMPTKVYRDATDSVAGGTGNVLLTYREDFDADWSSTTVTVNDGETYTMTDNY